VERVDIEISSLSCSTHPVETASECIQLLAPFSFSIQPGKLVALMVSRITRVAESDANFRCVRCQGVSGSGKSLLLDALSGNAAGPDGSDSLQSPSAPPNTPLKIGSEAGRADLLWTGTIALNGKRSDPRLRRALSVYVRQDDALLPGLTVSETLHYAARLSLHNVGEAEQQRRVRQELRRLALVSCADVLISALSGGQRRRYGEFRPTEFPLIHVVRPCSVSLAIELLSENPVVVLDEPTSGLDAHTAQSVTLDLKRLADLGTVSCLGLARLACDSLLDTRLFDVRMLGHTVICSVHQPRPEQIALFDELILLSRGQCVYAGPANKLVPYLANLGYECPPHVSPVQWAVELSAVHISGTAADEQASRERLLRLAHAFKAVSSKPAASSGTLFRSRVQSTSIPRAAPSLGLELKSESAAPAPLPPADNKTEAQVQERVPASFGVAFTVRVCMCFVVSCLPALMYFALALCRCFCLGQSSILCVRHQALLFALFGLSVFCL
jgi:ABC-type multidrug transport system ATPase subunit